MSIQNLIQDRFVGVSQEQLNSVKNFHGFLIEGNKIQNLTRLINDEDFVEGHFRDCWELLKGFDLQLGSSVVDLGSGCGVPGLLTAAIEPSQTRNWHLVDSEKQKIEFLASTTLKMGLGDKVIPTWSRGELFLKDNKVDSVVSRAVGPISRIMNWIGPCSTWNNLFLFKGKSWDEEWVNLPVHNKKNLNIKGKHEYTNSRGVYRVIIHLEHVPRGTKKT